MIKIVVNEEGEACPFWICDCCGTIVYEENANILYSEVWVQGDQAVAYIACKNCSSRQLNSKTHWTQLDEALKQLHNNSKFIERNKYAK